MKTFNRAPKGGIVSPVNGKFYAGGQFMPVVKVEKANEWALRPVPNPFDGSKNYRPVAKFADGRELAVGPCNGFKTIREARIFIIGKFDGGRAFPNPPAPRVETVYTAEDMAEFEAIRNRHRFAGIGTPPAMI